MDENFIIDSIVISNDSEFISILFQEFKNSNLYY
jgi:hypothetical protein